MFGEEYLDEYCPHIQMKKIIQLETIYGLSFSILTFEKQYYKIYPTYVDNNKEDIMMARPKRCRRVCFEPVFHQYGPYGMEDNEKLQLNIDEFEVIRLIDFEKKTHEQCAKPVSYTHLDVYKRQVQSLKKFIKCLYG